MVKEIRARFSKGKIEPLEELDLEEGEEVRVIIPDRPKAERMIAALRASAGGWKDIKELGDVKLEWI